MSLLDVTFDIPSHIAEGLHHGALERFGGVIRDVGSKQVVMWLRENGASSVVNMPGLPLNLIIGGLNAVATGAKAYVEEKGFTDVNGRLDRANEKLDGISGQVGDVGRNLQHMQGILQITSAASILNLGVSVVGFAIIAQRLRELEKRLQKAQEVLSKINYKIDLGYYANFRAALDLAASAFTMSKPENRRSSALAAINRFLEAEHIYTDYTDQELEKKSQVADEYLLTLSLAYLAEVRCYLELGEFDTALRRFQEGSDAVRFRTQRYIELLLTSNPAVYLHPQLQGKVDLHKLTKVYQWMDSSFDENSVFELQRENLFRLAQDPNKWVDALPPAIIISSEVKGSVFGNREEMKREAMKRLPEMLEAMESIIETNYRFEAYQTEVKAIAQLGISFHDWLQLTPKEAQPEGSSLMYIIPAEPLAL